MNWSKSDYAAYQARRASSGAKPKCPVWHEPLGSPPRKAQDAIRIIVRLTSCRIRLLDPDNLCPKYFIDGLRYAGLLPDDREKDICLEIRQVKVATKGEERTEIELE